MDIDFFGVRTSSKFYISRTRIETMYLVKYKDLLKLIYVYCIVGTFINLIFVGIA